ncbi:MAG: cytochrome c, partial [Chitinophagaceae bacterium]
MKKLFIIASILITVASIIGCEGKGNNPGYAYMPDMYYSRAYEAYNYNKVPGDQDFRGKGIFFNGNPVP